MIYSLKLNDIDILYMHLRDRLLVQWMALGRVVVVVALAMHQMSSMEYMLVKVKASVLASIKRLPRCLEETPRQASRKACQQQRPTTAPALLAQYCYSFATGAAARFCLVILALLCLPRGTLSVPNRTSNSISSPRNQHAYAWRK